MTSRIGGILTVVLLAGLGLGMVHPPQARAGDTGKVLAAIAAGALVYSILDRDEGRCDVRYYYRDRDGCYEYGVPQYYNPGVGRARAYNRGYNDGYDDGFDDGTRVGYRWGYRDGYGDGRSDRRHADRGRGVAWGRR